MARARGLDADVGDVAGARGLDPDVDDVAGVEGLGDDVAGAEGVGAGVDDIAGDAEVLGTDVSALDAAGVFSVSESLLSVSKISLDLCFFWALFSSDCLVRGRFLP